MFPMSSFIQLSSFAIAVRLVKWVVAFNGTKNRSRSIIYSDQSKCVGAKDSQQIRQLVI